MSGALRALLAGLAAIFAAAPALAQNGNLDAGKTPAQLYASSCAGCHKSVNEVKGRATANFLRQHYTTSREEAAAMAAYVQSAPGDARTATRRTPTSPITQTPTDTASRTRKPPPAGERTARATDEPTTPPPGRRRPGRTDDRPVPAAAAPPKPAPVVTAAAPPEPPAASAPPRRVPDILLPEDTPPLPPNVKRALLPEEVMSPPAATGPAAANPRFEE